MIGFKIALALFFALPSMQAHAEWNRYENFKVNLDAPKSWQVVNDLYGVPITLLGPERGGERAVLLIQNTPIAAMSFDPKALIEANQDYIKGRKEWLEKLENSRFVDQLAPRVISNPTGLSGFDFAYRYVLRNTKFEEHSLQLSCGDRVYLLKTLSSDKNTAEDRKTLAQAVDHFQCATVTQSDGTYVPGPLHQIQDLIHQNEASAWPTTSDFKTASLEGKAKTLEALVDFYKRYDAGTEDGDEKFILNTQKNAFQEFASTLSKLLASAHAESAYNCFFGGWPSRFISTKTGGMTCDYPEHQNSDYPKESCSMGQLACNPSLFGDGLCIEVDNSKLRAHATLECEIKFNASGKKYEDIVKDPKFNQKLLDESVTSAREVCTKSNYSSSNYGLCHTLETKLQASIALGKHAKSAEDNQFIDHLDAISPADMTKSLTAVNSEWDNFQKECFIPGTGATEKSFKSDNADCVDRLSKITDDFDKIEKTEKITSKSLNTNGSKIQSGTCEKCAAMANGAGAPDATVPSEGGKCTLEQTKRIKDRQCNLSSPEWWLHQSVDEKPGEHSCLSNLYHSITADLWGNIKGVGQLIAVVGKGAGHLAMDSVRGVGHLIGFKDADNEMANKASQVSHTSDSYLKTAMHHLGGTVVGIGKAIVDQVISFLDNDAFCQSWSGTPHWSTCIAPANRSCMSCMDTVNGACSLIGYVAGEILPMVLTGGSAAIVEKSGLALKVGDFIAEASKTGKLLKYVAEASEKLPNLAKLSKANEEANLAEKVTIATRLAKTVEATQKTLASIEKFTTGFKSILGNFADTLEKLRGLKTATKLARGSAKLGWKATKAVVTLPAKPYELAYKIGFSVGDGLADRAFVKASETEAMFSLKESGTLGPEFVKAPDNYVPPQVTKIGTKANSYVEDLNTLDEVNLKSARKQKKLNKLIDKQVDVLAQVNIETDPEKLAALTPQERLDNLNRAAEAARESRVPFNKGPLQTADKNANKVEKLLEKKALAVDYPTGANLDRKASAYQADLNDSLAASKSKPLNAKSQARLDDLVKKQNTLLAVLKENTGENKATAKAFNQLDENARKIQTLTDRVKPKIELPSRAPESPLALSALSRAIIYSPLPNHYITANKIKSDAVMSANTGRTSGDLEFLAKKDGVTVEAKKAEQNQFSNEKDFLVEMRNKRAFHQAISTAEEARIKKSMSLEEFNKDTVKAVTDRNTKLANEIAGKMMTGDALTAEDYENAKLIGSTPEEINQRLSNDSNAKFPPHP